MSREDPTALDEIHTRHSVLGIDGRGRIHHYVADWGREYVFEDGGAVFVVAEDGLYRAFALGDRDVSEWIAMVAAETGWQECSFISLRGAFESLGDGQREIRADGGHCDGGSRRWDTPCGVHHGYVFLAGACAGAAIVLSIWVMTL